MLLPFFSKKKSKKGLIGVDFKPNRIALAHIMHAEQPGAKPRLKQCAFKDIDSQSQTELSSVLHKTTQSFPVNQFECNSSVSGGRYELLLVDAPNVESSELKQAVRWRIKDQLSYHIDDAVIDVFEIPGQQSTRAKLMYVVTSQRQDLDQQVSLFKQVGMSIQSIDIYELAQRNIAAIMPEDKDGIVTLRMNESDGLLTITRNGVLYLTRKIDFGCQRLQQVMNASSDDELELSLDELDPVDVQSEHEALNELDSTSESLAESSSEPAQLSEQSRLIIDEVVLEIQRSLDYYVSHFNQRAVSKIIIAPLVREIPGVLEYISDMLGIKTEIIDFNKYLDVAKPLSNEMQSRCFDAIGLALRQDVVQG